jgi:hypothetical protein
VGATDAGVQGGEPRRSDNRRASVFGLAGARGQTGPGDVGRAGFACSFDTGAVALMGRARRSAALRRWSAGRPGSDLGYTRGFASCARRPDLGCAGTGARAGSSSTGLAAYRRALSFVGRSPAAPRGASFAAITRARRARVGTARTLGARLGSSCSAGTGMGDTHGARLSTRRTWAIGPAFSSRAFSPRYAGRARVGHACSRVAFRHAFRTVVEPSGRSRLGSAEARTSRCSAARSGVGRLGSAGRRRAGIAADRGAVVGRPGDTFHLQPSRAGLERTGGSRMERSEDRGAGGSSGSILVGACRACGPRRRASGRTTGVGRTASSRGLVRPVRTTGRADG